jgi:hypothetical protein
MVLAPERALASCERRHARSRRPPPYDAVHARRGQPLVRRSVRRSGALVCKKTRTTSPIALVCKKTRNCLGACLYKRRTVLRARGRRTAGPPLPPLVFTVNPTLRSLASPTRLAPTAPRVPSSFPARLLVCPSCQLTGVVPPAAAAVGAHTSPVSGRPFDVSKPPGLFLSTPGPSQAASPAEPAGEVAGIPPAAPPRAPLDHIARPTELLGSLVQTRDLSVIF